MSTTELYLDFLDWKANSHTAELMRYLGKEISYSVWLEQWKHLI